MNPIEQTRMAIPGEQAGNCFAACLASILECGIEEVPNLGFDEAMSAYMERVQLFLCEHRLFAMFAPAQRCTSGCGVGFPGHVIAIVGSPRVHGGRHAVVWNIRDGLAWDPHPQREMGIGDVQEFVFLLPIYPESVSGSYLWSKPKAGLPWATAGYPGCDLPED